MNLLKLPANFILILNIVVYSHSSFAQLTFNWAQSIGSNVNQPNHHVRISASAMSQDNSVVFTGSADTSVDFDPGPGVYKLTSNTLAFGSFLAKYDSAGNFIYARAVPDTMWGTYPEAAAWKVVCDNYGNAYVILYFDAAYVSAGQYAGMGIKKKSGVTVYDSLPIFKFRNSILKYNSNGKCTSVKKMAIDVELSDAIIDHHDNLIISGYFGEYMETVTKDLAPGPGVSLFTAIGPDAFITKMNPAGHLTFIKVLHYVYTGPYNGVIADIYATNLAVDSKDNILFSVELNGLYDVDPGPDTNLVHAAYASKNENYNYIFEKLDSSGNFMYRKKFFNTQFGMGLKIDGNDNILLYGALDTPIDIDPSNNNTVIINPNGYYGSFLLAKFNNNGAYQYSKFITGGEENFINDFHITKNNKFFFYAIFSDSTALAPAGIPSIGECSAHGKKIIVQMDTMFNAFYYDEISNSNDSTAWYTQILSGNQNDIYLCGTYNGRFDADFSPAVYYLENTNVNPAYDVWSAVISKYQFPANLRTQAFNETDAGFIFEKNISKIEENVNSISIAANAATPSATYLFENLKMNCELRVYSSAGQQVYKKTFNARKSSVQLNLKPGIYLVQIGSGTNLLSSGKLPSY